MVDYSRTITARILNRTVVGLPLCASLKIFATLYCPDHYLGRDPDWVNFTVQGTMDVVKEGVMLGGVPDFLLT